MSSVSSSLGSTSNLADSGSSTEDATSDVPFWKNKFSKLVVILAAVSGVLLIAFIVATSLAIRARRAVKHAPRSVTSHLNLARGVYSTPYDEEK